MGASPSRGSRRFAPLVLLAGVVALLALLPSALTLPQTNPATTLEYAPVPPSGDGPPPPGGSLSSLSLATSGSLGAGDAAGAGTGAGGRGALGVGKNPSTKRCVGRPPRQAEDPMSPPCVAFFDGDNGGATHTGVSRDEIVVLVYFDGNIRYGVGQWGNAPVGPKYCDVDLPPNTGGPGCYTEESQAAGDHMFVRTIRAYSRHFNDRYQTYGRRVHYWVFWSAASTAERRRADAADNWRRLRPFAVLDLAGNRGFNADYDEAMAPLGPMMFSTYVWQVGDFFRRHAPNIWSFGPDVEHAAEGYTDYVCRKVAPHRVSHAHDGRGTDGAPFNGRGRRYGFMYSTDTRFPGLQRFASLAREQLARCGVTPAVEVTFPIAGYGYTSGGRAGYENENAAKLKQADVTTLLWLGGLEGRTSHAMDRLAYYPEIVIAGDGFLEGTSGVRLFQNQRAWRNAWVVTSTIREDSDDASDGFRACKEGDPSVPDGACSYARIFYRDQFTLFRGIQVAGPRLTPKSVDAGMHAIPALASESPYVAACFYDPGDYTCVKDMQEQWWDPPDTNPDDAAGCYRMRRGGRRFLPGTWPAGDDVFTTRADPCTSYDNRAPVAAQTPTT